MVILLEVALRVGNPTLSQFDREESQHSYNNHHCSTIGQLLLYHNSYIYIYTHPNYVLLIKLL